MKGSVSMNIVLIGLPGSGKSTCGVNLAKYLCKCFIDTDLLIQQNENMKLHQIIKEKGTQYFSESEEKAIVSLYTRNCVIATGGSAVYSQAAMNALKKYGVIVYLKINYKIMKKRIHNYQRRGVVLKDGFSLKEMYSERIKLYERYADITVNGYDGDVNYTVQKIVNTLKTNGYLK